MFYYSYLILLLDLLGHRQFHAVHMNKILADYTNEEINQLLLVLPAILLEYINDLLTFTSNSYGFIQSLSANLTKLSLEVTRLRPTMLDHGGL